MEAIEPHPRLRPITPLTKSCRSTAKNVCIFEELGDVPKTKIIGLLHPYNWKKYFKKDTEKDKK